MSELILPERKLSRDDLRSEMTFYRACSVVTYPEHWHDYYEWIFYRGCAGFCHLNGTACPLCDGASLLLSPYDFHRTEVLSRSESVGHVRVCFTTAAIPWFTPESGYYLAESDPFLEDLLAAFEQAAALDIRRHLLAAMLLRMRDVARPIPDSRTDSTRRIVRAALSYLHSHYAEATLNAAAAFCGVSGGYLSGVLSKCCGIGFSDILTDIRLDHARALLLNTDQSVTDVALSCGYNDLSNFLRTFRRHTGCTPGAFRAAQRP